MCGIFLCLFFFFFKQKTAYEVRISDWSSDVCSSDLLSRLYHPALYDRDVPVGSYWEASAPPLARDTPPLTGAADCEVAVIGAGYTGLTAALTLVEGHGMGVTVLEAGTPGWGASESGRASCRERVCQNV